MKKFFTNAVFAGLVAFACVSGFAQNQEFRRWEIYGGYQFNSVSTGLGDLEKSSPEGVTPTTPFENRVSAHGFNASVTGNLTRLFGLKFDYSSNNATIFEDSDIRIRYRNQQFLGGVQIKNNDTDGPTVKPWGHVLAGLGNQKLRCEGDCFIKLPSPTGVTSNPFTETNNSFAMVFGGGVDIKVHERIDIRVIQVDYNPIFFGGNQTLDLPDRTQNNWRFSWGVVFH